MYNSVQWRIIARELARTGGVASQAAKNLGATSPAFKRLSTATLYPAFLTAERAEDAQCKARVALNTLIKPFIPFPSLCLCASVVRNPVVIIPQLLDKALAEALQAVRSNHAPVGATSLAELFGLYAKGLQTLLRK
jgi:hypothetical protein